ncbi:uncharacterized protein LOC129003799 [Macrosteles quadrilineatus]|uniref:uncharacterized protein LOC129003799 n=1 Tax=Macrosteles quadrilineatus TaxID=74068 RepID=UPI0023E24D9A|nr:uncharacterized protein LOC129003799 [Macrosteles quadrilineatus]
MDVDNLISQVFMRPALWDKCDKNHHNRFVLDKLWNEVAEELKTKQTAVRGKWKTLRDKFRTVLVSIPKPKSGDAQDCVDYTGEWKYYKSLIFLKDQFTPRQSSGNFGVTTPVPSLEESAGEDNDCEEDFGDYSELFCAPSTENSHESRLRHEQPITAERYSLLASLLSSLLRSLIAAPT